MINIKCEIKEKYFYEKSSYTIKTRKLSICNACYKCSWQLRINKYYHSMTLVCFVLVKKTIGISTILDIWTRIPKQFGRYRYVMIRTSDALGTYRTKYDVHI